MFFLALCTAFPNLVNPLRKNHHHWASKVRDVEDLGLDCLSGESALLSTHDIVSPHKLGVELLGPFVTPPVQVGNRFEANNFKDSGSDG